MAPTWLPSASSLSTSASLFSRSSIWALCSLSIFCPKQVCYDRLGCFDSDAPWFDVVLRPYSNLPQNPTQVDVQFFFSSSPPNSASAADKRLPTSRNDDDAATRLIDAAFDDDDDAADAASTTAPLVFLIHGFFTDANSDWILGAKDAFLRFHGSNVVRVGWNTSPPNYAKVFCDACLPRNT